MTPGTKSCAKRCKERPKAKWPGLTWDCIEEGQGPFYKGTCEGHCHLNNDTVKIECDVRHGNWVTESEQDQEKLEACSTFLMTEEPCPEFSLDYEEPHGYLYCKSEHMYNSTKYDVLKSCVLECDPG